jgi:hypothetical protein
MFTNKILNEIHTIVDEFYPAQQMLQKYKHKPDVPLGFLMCVTVRAKIYENIQELLRRYKKHEPYKDLLNRIFHQLKLHRYQIKKLSKTHASTDHQSVHRFCIALASLIHLVFREEIPH